MTNFCFQYEGSGDELITPRYSPPPRPKWRDEDFNSNINDNNNVNNPGGNVCDDDEDCRESGSGVFFEGKWASKRNIFYS